MDRNSKPESLHSGRLRPGDLLHRLGSLGMMVGRIEESPEELDVIRTSYHESSAAELAREACEEKMSAQAFEQMGIYRPGAELEPDLLF